MTNPEDGTKSDPSTMMTNTKSANSTRPVHFLDLAREVIAHSVVADHFRLVTFDSRTFQRDEKDDGVFYEIVVHRLHSVSFVPVRQ